MRRVRESQPFELAMKTVCPISLCLLFAFALAVRGETVLFDASKPETPGTSLSTYRVATESKDGLLIFTNQERADYPGITLRGKWSLGLSEVLVLELENKGSTAAQVTCRLDSTDANPDAGRRTFSTSTTLEVGEKKRWEITPPFPLPPPLRDKVFGMRGFPGGVRGGSDGKSVPMAFDSTDLVAVIIFCSRPTEEHSVGIKRVYIDELKGTAEIASRNANLNLPPEQFFPMIDRYGQYKHADWPGKVKSDDDLKKNREAEEKALADSPGMPDRSQYGGWTKGPKLNATGSFYPVKRDGIWWLVDPEGYLFWSHGVDCVRATNAETPITDREHLFEELLFDACKGRGGTRAVYGYYVGKTQNQTYNFTMSNLMLKYGEGWRPIIQEIAHKRLRAWGMNTIANWSESQIYMLRKTPYTPTLGASGPVIAGSQGYWGQFRDPFHPDFRSNLAAAMSRQQETANDPWCVGYFVDNELGWGDETSLAIGALVSPETQPAKSAVVDMLRKKYETIEKLNTAWSTTYADWNAMMASTTAPDKAKAAIATDLREGYSLIADEYHRVIREEVKRVAPNKIYFGCRFAWVNDRAVRSADKYCDVLSFNLYRTEVSGFKLPEGVDKAVVIGEFHFGALDRGMLHTGLVPTANQQARATAYERYVRSALEHPNFVGSHWFQYGEQATTGRGLDGENYQIGLVSVCDTPYPEIIEAVKRVGSTMYDVRMERERASANLVTVNGTVTLDGGPVDRAIITFHPTDPNGAVATGLTNAQGQFSLRTSPGDYKVCVSKQRDSDTPNVTIELLPEMYVQPAVTPLQVTVMRGRNTIDLMLVSR